MRISARFRPLAICASVFLATVTLVGSLQLWGAEPVVDYGRQIRTLLSDRCYKCHGPDGDERKGGLRLDLRDGALQKLDSGGLGIVPGKSAESLVYQRISSTNPDEKMPPADSGKELSAAEIALIKTWIDQGANWKDHWSFLKPERPDTPQIQQPQAARNAIDHFVFARLEREKIKPSTAADKATLIRRVTLDLTGLPPTIAEVNAFVKDTSADAYEKVVDRLLKSSRYGEHMARYWLDAVRYGDTHGLHFDNERSLWPYRDWVINAFNQNMPFDQFTIEQLAGDQLPNATLDQKTASGFNRCNVTTSEGGSINDEVLMRYAVDRTEAMATVWMGLTLGCAVCHSHKFDPISQKEFYQLYAFFNGAADAAMDGNALAPAPIIKKGSDEQLAKLKSFDEQLAKLKGQSAELLAKIEYKEPEGADLHDDPTVARDFVWFDDTPPANVKLDGNTPWEFVSKPDHPVFSGEKSTRRSVTGLSQHFFQGAKPGLKVGEGDKLFTYVYLDPANPPKEIMLQWHAGGWEHRAYWGEDAIAWGVANSASRYAMGTLPVAGAWVRLEIEAAKVGLSAGATIDGWAFTQFGGTCYWDKSGILTRTPQEKKEFESQAAWEAYEKKITKSALPKPVLDAIKVAADKRKEEQSKLIREHFLQNIYPKTRGQFADLNQQIAEVTKQRTSFDTAIPTTMVMADMPKPRDTFVLVRGQYDKKGEKVEAGVPAIFPPLPEGAPVNRLGLAKWLVDPSHPLTARVIMNRFWQQYFGVGIVKTSEDFGAQGELPTNPALLDWLASEFVASGWDVKAMQKLIVMSATYQQSSRITPELAQKDLANEWLARGPRFRLDAEVIRDNALSIAGLLVEKQGGRSVKPYQPDGLWEAVAFRGSNTQNYKMDEGDSLYRRGMYVFWKRTSPPASLTTFDAPSRETCTVRRPRTNTPLQALALMNDIQYVEAARKMAERMFAEGGDSASTRIVHGFQLATARIPSKEELEVLQNVYDREFAIFKSSPDSAKKLLSIGKTPRNEKLDAVDHAALTMVANLILNLDETVTKE